MSYNIYAALEIGTSRTVLAVGESERGGKLRVSALANIASAGVRKSSIINITDATRSILGVLKEIEQEQQKSGGSISLGNVFLVVNGQHVNADVNQAMVSVPTGRVTDEDIRAVCENSRNRALQNDRELLDIIEQDYTVDQMGGIATPKGLSGQTLRLSTLHVHADHNRLENARKAAEGAHLEIREPLFAAICATEAVVEEHEKKNGVLVLDLGGGSTGYTVYSDGCMITTGAIGIGGDHITNDIAHAFQVSQGQAEILKRHHGSALVTGTGLENRVKVEASTPGMEERTLSARALNTVINARVKELLQIIREKLDESDLLSRIHAGVVLTGGGAQLKDLDLLIKRELGTQVHFGKPLYVDGLENEEFPAQYAAIAGALMYAHRNYEEKSIWDGLFGGFFK